PGSPSIPWPTKPMAGTGGLMGTSTPQLGLAHVKTKMPLRPNCDASRGSPPVLSKRKVTPLILNSNTVSVGPRPGGGSGTVTLPVKAGSVRSETTLALPEVGTSTLRPRTNSRPRTNGATCRPPHNLIQMQQRHIEDPRVFSPKLSHAHSHCTCD